MGIAGWELLPQLPGAVGITVTVPVDMSSAVWRPGLKEREDGTQMTQHLMVFGSSVAKIFGINPYFQNFRNIFHYEIHRT